MADKNPNAKIQPVDLSWVKPDGDWALANVNHEAGRVKTRNKLILKGLVYTTIVSGAIYYAYTKFTSE